jgi:hypothetical protein
MADRRELPEELLMNIMWRLKLSMGSHNAPRIENRVLTKTLFSCMLASRTLYRLAKPVLYHTINHKDLFTIAQHLAHEPALADHVRELSCPERSCHDFITVMVGNGPSTCATEFLPSGAALPTHILPTTSTHTDSICQLLPLLCWCAQRFTL